MSAPKIKRKKNKHHNKFSAPEAAAAPPTPSPIDVTASHPKPPANLTFSERVAAKLDDLERQTQCDMSYFRDLANRIDRGKSAATPEPPPKREPEPAPEPEPEPEPELEQPPRPRAPRPGHATGPITPAGKARASHNAYRHGLTAPLGREMTYLPDEDPDEHERLRLQFNEQFVPMSSAELELVSEIVDALWLARRARDLQTQELCNSYPDHHLLSLYLRYETAHTRAHHAGIKTLLTMQKDRRNRNQHHEEWDEPLVWGFANRFDLETFTFPDVDEPFESEETAGASAPPPPNDTSFRNPAAATANNPLQPTTAPPKTTPNQSREEVKPAA